MTISRPTSTLLVVLALLAAARMVAGDSPPVVLKSPVRLPLPGTVVSFVEENDKFTPSNEDRYYTQGMRFSFNSDEHHLRIFWRRWNQLMEAA